MGDRMDQQNAIEETKLHLSVDVNAGSQTTDTATNLDTYCDGDGSEGIMMILR